MALTVPNGPVTKTIVYSDLRGVDFSQDASLVDRQHSPDMLNMISDEGGSPVKRKGWEVLYNAREHGHGYPEHFRFTNYWHFNLGGSKYHFLSYEWSREGSHYRVGFFNPTTGELTDANPSFDNTDHPVRPNYAFYVNDSFYYAFHTGIYKAYLNNGNVRTTRITAKIPLTIILRDPADGGGVAYEPLNLLSTYRTEGFQDRVATGSTDFLLSTTEEPTYVQLKYLDSNGQWRTDPDATIVNVDGQYYARINGHPVSGDPVGDNIRVTYSAGTDNSSRIFNCTNAALFSHGGLDQVFVTGNSAYRNYVWYSDYGDPTYFPDLNFLVVGNGNSACKGFLNVGDNLAVIKEQSEQDVGVYYIYETSLSSKTVTTNTYNGSEGETTGSESETTQEYTYAVRRSNAGVGAISNKCFSILQDEPLFLSKDGVQGIVSMNTTSEKVVRNRSRFVDKKLLNEPNLDKAFSCVHKGYYYIFINGHVYVLDSRHTASDRRGNTSYMYEAYYWDNVPAVCGCVADDTIYFGTDDGKICRFKNTGNMTDYSDGSHYDSTEGTQVDGTAIHARWATRNDDDDAPQYFKTMMKKGTMCTIAPFEKSSVMVFIQVDQRPSQDDILAGQQNVGRYYVGEYYLNAGNIFPGPIDFSRLLFDTRQGPRDYFFRKKKKKYIRIQIILENATINEGFGIFHVVKTYSPTRYAK